ncbi:MAG: acetylxylan esterase [Prolixibacteraceae bacterium]
MMKLLSVFFCILLAGIFGVFDPAGAQPAQTQVMVVVSPDQADWEYNTGEEVTFSIEVFEFGNPLDQLSVSYRYGLEMLEPAQQGTVKLKDGEAAVKVKGLKEPGFLRFYAEVEKDGKTYTGYATAGFSVDQIKPTTTLPGDFQEFWENGKKELAKIPVKPVLTLIPDRCTDDVDVYHVSIQNIQGKVYGVLTMPKAEGKYPAILKVPGAGIRPYFGDVALASRGLIVFEIGIHGVPVNLPANVYTDLAMGALRGYQQSNMDNRDEYYYRRVYLGCVRSVDFIYGLPQFDGKNIAVAGGSQGGALSIVTAGLDSRIKYLAAFYPALCDLTGYLHGRTGGWPHLFKNDFTNKPDKIEVSKYYDVVNFARFVKVPGFYSWGFNDNVCPPTSMYSAYNLISAPKELKLYLNTGHWTYPVQSELRDNWLLEKLK